MLASLLPTRPLLTLACAVLVGSIAPELRAAEFCFTTGVFGPRTCNCTSANVAVTHCPAKEIDVPLPGGHITTSTRATRADCESVTLPPGHCSWLDYEVRCCVSDVFGIWSCDVFDIVPMVEAASDGDCD